MPKTSARSLLRTPITGFDLIGGGVSIGPAQSLHIIDAIPDILFTSEKIACSFVVCQPGGQVRADAALAGAKAVLELARRAADAFGKKDDTTGKYDYSDPRLVDTLFRLTAVACVPPGSPFFPSAYHEGPPSFAIGLENSDLLVEAFKTVSEKQLVVGRNNTKSHW